MNAASINSVNSVRAAVLSAPRELAVTSVPVGPLPASGGWIQVEACGICGSDWSWYDERVIPAPFIPGHEIVGRVVQLWGKPRAGVAVGDRVALEEALPCRECAVCLSGRHRMCPQSTRYGATSLQSGPGLWGGFAELVYLAPNATVHRVPESLDAELAVLFIPVSNGLSWISSAAALRPGESVAVLGVGQHGLASVAAARHCGAGLIIAAGRSGDGGRLKAAAAMGAHVIIDVDTEDYATVIEALTGGRGVDITVDTAPGATQTLDQAVTSSAIGARVILAGFKGARPSPVSTDVLIRREVTVRGVAARESWAIDSALSWLDSEPERFAAFDSMVVELAEVESALLAIGGRAPGERPVHAVVSVSDPRGNK